jgi:hypothetical protein
MLFFGMVSQLVKRYKCPCCVAEFNSDISLYLHVGIKHRDDIPENVTVKQFCFNKRRNKEYQICYICKTNKTDWNEAACRYNPICNSTECKLEARKRFKDNFKKKNGKDQDISDPEIQKNMLFNRKNSGVYKFKDGGEIRYMSSYEKDFLEFYELDLKLPSNSIEECCIYFSYKYKGKEHKYIPDYYIREYNLIIEIKSQETNHPKLVAIDKETEKLKDIAVVKSNSHNYIKVINKDYKHFTDLIEVLRSSHLNGKLKKDDKFIIIPKTKSSTGAFKPPVINYIGDKEVFYSEAITPVYKNADIVNFRLILDKRLIPKEYLEDEALVDKEDKILLRESNGNFNDKNKIIQIFKEFNVYYTKLYEKFINQDFLSVYHDIEYDKWTIIKFPNEIKILNNFIRSLNSGRKYKRVVIQDIFNYNVIIQEPVNNDLKSLANIDKKNYIINPEDNFIPMAGTLQGNKLVKVLTI